MAGVYSVECNKLIEDFLYFLRHTEDDKKGLQKTMDFFGLVLRFKKMHPSDI